MSPADAAAAQTSTSHEDKTSQPDPKKKDAARQVMESFILYFESFVGLYIKLFWVVMLSLNYF